MKIRIGLVVLTSLVLSACAVKIRLRQPSMIPPEQVKRDFRVCLDDFVDDRAGLVVKEENGEFFLGRMFTPLTGIHGWKSKDDPMKWVNSHVRAGLLRQGVDLSCANGFRYKVSGKVKEVFCQDAGGADEVSIVFSALVQDSLGATRLDKTYAASKSFLVANMDKLLYNLMQSLADQFASDVVALDKKP